MLSAIVEFRNPVRLSHLISNVVLLEDVHKRFISTKIAKFCHGIYQSYYVNRLKIFNLKSLE